MSLTLKDLTRKANQQNTRLRSRLKSNYDLARRLGFLSTEARVLQSHKREVILELAIEKGLIKHINDPKAG